MLLGLLAPGDVRGKERVCVLQLARPLRDTVFQFAVHTPYLLVQVVKMPVHQRLGRLDDEAEEQNVGAVAVENMPQHIEEAVDVRVEGEGHSACDEAGERNFEGVAVSPRLPAAVRERIQDGKNKQQRDGVLARHLEERESFAGDEAVREVSRRDQQNAAEDREHRARGEKTDELRTRGEEERQRNADSVNEAHQHPELRGVVRRPPREDSHSLEGERVDGRDERHGEVDDADAIEEGIRRHSRGEDPEKGREEIDRDVGELHDRVKEQVVVIRSVPEKRCQDGENRQMTFPVHRKSSLVRQRRQGVSSDTVSTVFQ